jgi:FtsP/CotA-like multicopper oxidase with cupredoxin domain
VARQLNRKICFRSACGSCGRPFGGIQAARDCFNDQCITADGVEKGVMSINRQIPGPSVHVCQNDTIVVDIINKMGGTAAAIHWHGFHQRKTPFYDGVPFITQCPIEYSTTFRYAFQAEEAGTQFYHSHSGHHKVNGHYGGIVIRRDPRNDPNRATYDRDLRDHLMVISDWMHVDAEM